VSLFPVRNLDNALETSVQRNKELWRDCLPGVSGTQILPPVDTSPTARVAADTTRKSTPASSVTSDTVIAALKAKIQRKTLEKARQLEEELERDIEDESGTEREREKEKEREKDKGKGNTLLSKNEFEQEVVLGPRIVKTPGSYHLQDHGKDSDDESEGAGEKADLDIELGYDDSDGDSLEEFALDKSTEFWKSIRKSCVLITF